VKSAFQWKLPNRRKERKQGNRGRGGAKRGGKGRARKENRETKQKQCRKAERNAGPGKTLEEKQGKVWRVGSTKKYKKHNKNNGKNHSIGPEKIEYKNITPFIIGISKKGKWNENIISLGN